MVLQVKEGLPFAPDLSPENSGFLLCFQLALLHSVSYFFSSINHLPPLYAPFLMLFYEVHAIDEVLMIKPSANVFVFGNFNVHHKDWLT